MGGYTYSRMMLLQACLNGSRTSEEHPGIPRTPAELAHEGRASVEAGAQLLHLHAYDEAGSETFAPEPCAAALRAVRAACPGIPISLSTSADIEPHPRRLECIAHWTELPELVTANQGEEGIVELCDLLIARGVGIEAGLLHLDDAHQFVKSGVGGRCVRVLIEPLDADPSAAVAHAAAMEHVLGDAGVTLEQIHHGDGVATWHVMARAVERGYGIRAGLEDTTKLPDGEPAQNNATLVRLGARMLAGDSPT
ncbi:MAG: 3-keto-5-aminohexanoate cleavage protein [Actinomycetota bacterium]